ncbi:hypothetical protein V1504DRAFT_205067 [Lipomyces starkeyi]
MRGAGEPSFETDFPPGTDMMGKILSGPAAAKQMEAELSSRLGGYFLLGVMIQLESLQLEISTCDIWETGVSEDSIAKSVIFRRN